MHYLAIGHICQDVTPEGRVLGGTATFAALTARAFGVTTTAITRIAPQVDLGALRGIECVRLPGEQTTTFENIYTPNGRVQILHATAGPIRRSDVMRRAVSPDVVHLAPIANEVDPDLVDTFGAALIGVTPQGWLRQWDAAGRVSRREWAEAAHVLGRAGAVVISIEDVSGDWDQVGRWAALARLLVVTQGRDGCTIYAQGQSPIRVPTIPVAETDPTGAGDVFAAAFFIQLRRSGDPSAAAQLAHCVAARSVTRRGLDSVPTSREAQDCMRRSGAWQSPVA